MAGAIALVIGLGLAFIGFESENILGVPVGSEKTETGELAFTLLLDGLPAPYDGYTDTYYIPQTFTKNGWSGKLDSAEGYDLSFAPDEMFSYRPSAVEYCHVFTMYVTDGAVTDSAKIMFTGLPALCLESGGEMRLFDPAAGGKYGARTVESACEFHVRGYESDLWPKKAYKLTLYGENGEYARKQLLSLRPDDDWLLSPMYGDRTKIREKLAMDIWNGIAAQSPYALEAGADGEYVEVFIDGDYAGLYLLTQRLDAKLAGGDGDDTVYLFDGPDIPSPEEFGLTHGLFCRDIEIRSTHTEYSPELWKNCRVWTDAVYRGIGEISKLQSLENIWDYYLFSCLVSSPRDGFQSFCLVAHSNYGELNFVCIPTDFKYSFGCSFSESELKNHTEYVPGTAFAPCPLFDALGTDAGLSERYEELKPIFDEAAILARAEEISRSLTASGALARDSARWPGTEMGAGREELEAWVVGRLEMMNGKFSEIVKR